MGYVSASEAQLDNIARSQKSTAASDAPRGRASVATEAQGSERSHLPDPVSVSSASRWLKHAACSLLAPCLIAVGAAAAAGQPAPPRVTQTPVGTMSDLMVKILYPASDAIFYVTTRTPSSDAEWTVLQGKALMVAESANLLMMPAHMRDEERWLADAKLMRDAGTAAFKAARAKDVKALEELNDALYQSCVTCHMHYRPNYGRR